MGIELRDQTETPRLTWLSRWFSRTTVPPATREPDRTGPEHLGPVPPDNSVQRLVHDLTAQDRYVFALLKATEAHVEDADLALARRAIATKMALVPTGTVPIVRSDGTSEVVEVPAFHIDRFAVTNRQFSMFVEAGGYDDLELWPQEVWPSLLRFSDRRGRPGPAFWEGGKPPAGTDDHPVVGVSWYEATAYARWVGKRLPTAAEWQKAGGWPDRLGGGGECTRYPWGDLFNPNKANLWAAGRGTTAPVDAFPTGDTPNGIRQMSGNVWEWLDDPLDAIPCGPDEWFQPWQPMRRIIGGAYDTYLSSEATCAFVTGQVELDRRPNLGFRCVVSTEALRDEP